MTSAVVFAYHNVGVRCMQVLIDQGVEIKLVVTHKDNPQENIWFESVEKLAQLHRIPVITPDDPNTEDVVQKIAAINPEYLFSFYYRNMLKKPLLDIPKKGAYNMHGSLLPKYRGRVPVNWAIIKGEKEAGATLHVMNEKPDNGPLVDQQSIPILINDTALDVFNKTVVAAEITLHRCLPLLLTGKAQLKTQDLKKGAYFGGRKAEDGRILWKTMTAEEVHNLVRAVAPPYPGAFFVLHGKHFVIHKTIIENNSVGNPLSFQWINGELYATANDGKTLRIVEGTVNGRALREHQFTDAITLE